MTDVALTGLSVSDPPGRWAALGFDVDADGELTVGDVRIRLGIAPAGNGITGWALRGVTGDGDVDGLPTTVGGGPALAGPDHPNGAVGIDHVVIATPDLDRLAPILDARGLGLSRRRELRGRRLGFRRIGPAIMEIVEATDATATAFWGATFVLAHRSQLDLLADGPLVADPHDALQPGRRIAAVTRAAGLSTRIAFMDPG